MARDHITVLTYGILSLMPFASSAVPDLKTRNIYYMISGKTIDAIKTDIRNKTPVKHNGKLHVAYTKWNVNWRFWWLELPDACEITRVATTLDVAYTLPKLEHQAALPAKLLARWESYFSALLDHEQGHKDLGMKAATEIEQTISNMEPRTSCSQLERDANELAKTVISKYSRLEKEYDRTTNHGRNTGVILR
jgi:predicted secreted Zn-dependent protease